MAQTSILSKTIRRFGRREVLLAAVFILGCAIRLWGLSTSFYGINQDEASIGYDAWSLANYGIDRNGVSWPAYLIAWGSGQNAGYAYLLLPFVKLFGLSLFTLRLPMALVGCASLWALYTILRRAQNQNLALLGLFLFAICPWHILKSRWALESNLFPDLLLWGIALLCAGLAGGKKRYFYIGFAVFGLSCWAYATSFLLLPLFLLPVLFVLWRRKTLTLLEILGCLLALLATAWPIVLFSLITLFDLSTIETPLLTIPAMPFRRTSDIALLHPQPVTQLVRNAKALFSILFSQADGLLLNGVPGFGLIYLISMPLAALGLVRSTLPRVRGGKLRGLVPGGWLFLPLLGASLLLGILVEPNVNRANALWIPLVWYWILGAWELFSLDRVWKRFLPAVYLLYFLVFTGTLFGSFAGQLNDSRDGGIIEAVQYADTLGVEVYVDTANQSYIKIIFATQMPPDEFRAGITQEEPGEYGTVTAFGKWHCYPLPDEVPDGPYAVIVPANPAYAEAGWQVEEFGSFIVATPPG